MIQQPLTIRIFHSFAEARAIRPEWQVLARTSLMSQWEWLSRWWDHHQAGGGSRRSKLMIAAALNQDSEVVGIAPFYLARNLTGRSLRILGDGNTCSDYTRIVAQAGYEEQVGLALGQWIASRDFRVHHGAVDWLEIEGHERDEPAWGSLWNTLEEAGWSIHQKELEGAWWMTLPNDWETYYRAISKARRRKINKACSHLMEGRATFRVLKEVREIQQAWPTFVSLHQKRRQQLGQPGCFANPTFAAFLKQVVLDYAAVQNVWMPEVAQQGQPFGYLLMFRTPNRLWMYQSGFDPDFDRLEPGHLINTCTIRQAINEGVPEFDFLRGDEGYKAAWGTQRVPLWTTRCTAPQLTARVKDSLWKTGRQIKSWLALDSSSLIEPVVNTET